jgi:hypothetical protein
MCPRRCSDGSNASITGEHRFESLNSVKTNPRFVFGEPHERRLQGVNAGHERTLEKPRPIGDEISRRAVVHHVPS